MNLIENERKRFWGSVAKPAGKLITGDQRLHLQHLMTFWAPLSGTKIAEHNKLSWGGGVGGGDMPADGEVREVKFPHVNVGNNCISELFLPIFQVFNLISMFYLLIRVRQSRDGEMRSLPLWHRTRRHKVPPVQLPHQETFCHTGSRTVIECDILV